MLDLLGLIPGVGVVFDITNMIWYIAEGDMFGAICSAISALPVIGEVTGTVLAGTKLAKFGCSIAKIAKMTAHVGNIAKSTYVIGKVVRNNVERYIINGEEFSLSQLGIDMLTIGMELFAMKNAAKGIVETEKTPVCIEDGAFNNNEAHNVVNYMKLKEQYRVTELANDAVDSLTQTGKLPSNYITKDQARALGWKEGKALLNYAPGSAIGGDIFNNTSNILPSTNGRVWYEADVGQNYAMSRAKNPGYRIIYSNDGLIYGTFDHYDSIFPIYPYS